MLPLPTSSRPWKPTIRPYPFSRAAVHRNFTHFRPPNTDSSRLSSTSTWKRPSHCMMAFRSSFPPRVSYYALCDATPMHSFLNFFFGPLSWKERRHIQESIFPVRVFPFFSLSDILLALQQRSPEVQEGRHLLLHQCNTFFLDRDPGRQGTFSSILPYRFRCVNNKISCDLLFSCSTPIQVDATTSLQLMERPCRTSTRVESACPVS